MSDMISIAAFKIQMPFEAPFRAIAKWYKANQTRKTLCGLNARQLSDIGLERCDIDSVANRYR